MSVAAVNAIITYGAAPPADRYTVPAGKVVVVNFFCASRGFLQGFYAGILAVNGANTVTMITPNTNGPHAGPFVFNAGDVLTSPAFRGVGPSVGAPNPGDPAITPKLGVVGESYDLMANIKVPFAAILQQNSTNYTVPAGKIARFMGYYAAQAENDPTLVGGPCFAINGVDIADGANPGFGGGIGFYLSVGPLIAGPGSVISVNNAWPNTVGRGYINGWLFNAVP